MNGQTAKKLRRWSKKSGLPVRRLKKVYQSLSTEDKTRLKKAI